MEDHSRGGSFATSQTFELPSPPPLAESTAVIFRRGNLMLSGITIAVGAIISINAVWSRLPEAGLVIGGALIGWGGWRIWRTWNPPPEPARSLLVNARGVRLIVGRRVREIRWADPTLDFAISDSENEFSGGEHPPPSWRYLLWFRGKPRAYIPESAVQSILGWARAYVLEVDQRDETIDTQFQKGTRRWTFVHRREGFAA